MDLIITEIDTLIKQGKSFAANRKFMSVRLEEIPRSSRVKFAQLARRLNLPNQILKLLSPYVRPAVTGSYKATTEERALYAVGLTRLGAYQEANKILTALKADDFSQVYLFRAHICIFNWDYEGAIPLLKKYIDSLDDSYLILVAKLNLAAAFFHSGKNRQFLTIANELIFESERSKFHLIFGNSLELLSQYYILTKSYDLAAATLERAEFALKDSLSQYSFFVKKWRTVLNLLRKSPTPQSIADVERLKVEALAEKDWDAIRECDCYLAIAKGDSSLYKSVYLGTSLSGFRKKMQRSFSAAPIAAEATRWQVPLQKYPLSKLKEAVTPDFILTFGGFENSKNLLSSYPKMHKLLQILCRDFYRPIQVGEAFYNLYPNEYYSWETSSSRVFQVVKRLRWWFEKQKVPLTVEIDKSNLSLRALEPIHISLSKDHGIQTRREQQWERLAKKLIKSNLQTQFTSHDLTQDFNFSERSARRLIHWAKNEGLVCGGKGTGIKTYRITSKMMRAA